MVGDTERLFLWIKIWYHHQVATATSFGTTMMPSIKFSTIMFGFACICSIANGFSVRTTDGANQVLKWSSTAGRIARLPFGRTSFLKASFAATSGVNVTEEFDDSNEKTESTAKEEKLAMPWSDIQDWTLRDQLPKYTVMIPLTKDDTEKTNVYALWRTMIREVIEISGYPIDFLQEMHARQQERKGKGEESLTTPALLPYLDEFQFSPSGGISGKVYGIPGLADGTTIETSAISNVEVTLPKGFVRTTDGSAAYELGLPIREEFSTLEDTFTSTGTIMKSVSNNVASQVTPLMKATSSKIQTEEDPDQMLVRLGASTGILLAGALAVNMLSHHLTVNVFWV